MINRPRKDLLEGYFGMFFQTNFGRELKLLMIFGYLPREVKWLLYMGHKPIYLSSSPYMYHRASSVQEFYENIVLILIFWLFSFIRH